MSVIGCSELSYELYDLQSSQLELTLVVVIDKVYHTSDSFRSIYRILETASTEIHTPDGDVRKQIRRDRCLDIESRMLAKNSHYISLVV